MWIRLISLFFILCVGCYSIIKTDFTDFNRVMFVLFELIHLTVFVVLLNFVINDIKKENNINIEKNE